MLCGSGEVIWIGRKEDGDKEGKVAFFLAESKELLAPFIQAIHKADTPTKHPGLLRKLKEEGASFLTKLSREEGKPPSEVLADLLDLVWEGRASNDQFAPLRLSLHAKGGKSSSKFGSGFGRWYWIGELDEPSFHPDPVEESKRTYLAGRPFNGRAIL
ncbi:hypothetical protein [Cohnella faecalis]|uniref:hypothetical protein n=1 Tax=Cohnella faecalis TaxID=2315694 RepID=UPI001F2D3587|nr:hypothetical protein [Cohnella faecalis]